MAGAVRCLAKCDAGRRGGGGACKALSHCPFVPGITMWPSAGDLFFRGGRSVARGDNARLESSDRGWPLDTRY